MPGRNYIRNLRKRERQEQRAHEKGALSRKERRAAFRQLDASSASQPGAPSSAPGAATPSQYDDEEFVDAEECSDAPLDVGGGDASEGAVGGGRTSSWAIEVLGGDASSSSAMEASGGDASHVAGDISEAEKMRLRAERFAQGVPVGVHVPGAPVTRVRQPLPKPKVKVAKKEE